MDLLQEGAAAPPPDFTQMPGSSAGNPIHIVDVNRGETQKVEVVGGRLEVAGKVDANVTNQVNVKHVGSIAVTQGGEFVVQLQGGGTIPVYVEGGRLVADIEGGLEGLATRLADTEVGLRAVGAL